METTDSNGFNLEVIGEWSESMTFDVTQERLVAYAAEASATVECRNGELLAF